MNYLGLPMEKRDLHSCRITMTLLCVTALLGVFTKQQVSAGATSANTEKKVIFKCIIPQNLQSTFNANFSYTNRNSSSMQDTFRRDRGFVVQMEHSQQPDSQNSVTALHTLFSFLPRSCLNLSIHKEFKCIKFQLPQMNYSANSSNSLIHHQQNCKLTAAVHQTLSALWCIRENLCSLNQTLLLQIPLTLNKMQSASRLSILET